MLLAIETYLIFLNNYILREFYYYSITLEYANVSTTLFNSLKLVVKVTKQPYKLFSICKVSKKAQKAGHTPGLIGNGGLHKQIQRWFLRLGE